ncbi:MAG: GNAT family N-acetyltransferase [Bacteroidetes bacterium]|nr:GNAT family N-acetyltransferase [Bacteroidota bacterium]
MTKQLHYKKATTLAEMLPQYKLINQLTPQLSELSYHNYLVEMIPHQYYQLVVILESEIVAVCGYWIGTKLYCGKYLELDNFVVDERYRKTGIGKHMILWLEKEAKNERCDVMMLDAYVENFKAHAFYYRNGFVARGFHYIRSIN